MRAEAAFAGGMVGFLVPDAGDFASWFGGPAGLRAKDGGPLGFFVLGAGPAGFFVPAGALPRAPSDAFADLSLCCPSSRGPVPLSVIV